MSQSICQPQSNEPRERASPVAHFLSFDVEEYFHAEAAWRAGVRQEDWETIPSRLGPCVDRILQLLADHRASATFFVLGWVARHQQAVIRRIVQAGQEVASHGMDHRMLTRVTPEEFRQDLLDSRRLLEDISGKPVLGYRAPTFSIMHRTAWALDVLAEAGYRYDSSVFPVRHDRYGVPEAPRWAHQAQGPAGREILEIPPLTLRMVGANWPVGGGGYLRLLPVQVVGRALRAVQRQGRPGMLYLHPWEIDADQPVLPMRPLQRWRHRVNLARTEAKLRWLLQRYRFTDVASQLDALAAMSDPAFAYGQALPAKD